MCGRYYLDREAAGYVRAFTQDHSRDTGDGIAGDISPSMDSLVLRANGRDLCPDIMKWGFPGFTGKNLLINARAETVLEKRSFSDSVLKRRCVIPAKWFYEWDSDHNIAAFQIPDQTVIFLAGFFDLFDLVNRYVILTTAANESMMATHDRMPLMIAERDISDWIHDDTAVKDFLNAVQPQLVKKQEYEQLRFF